ncbi:hypothetical protein OE88DRAFT_548735 [Heliocybe sulcata]|uniref:Uncharacterized protein n=1 Tax=Heliocybe sulcata TaxID=5364 RepID=A0A5C3MWL5_9AGAM|nr:hypothetical protein OE88DRAFT_548735 [Heliocybe sulcata]
MVPVQVMSLLLGAYAIIFLAALYFLLSNRRSSRSHMYLVPTTIALFVIAFAQVVMQFLLLLLTKFSGNADDPSSVQQAQLLDTNNLLEMLNMFLTVTNNLIADCLLVWRCWNICNRKILVVAGPAVLLFFATLAGYTSWGLSIKFITMTRGVSSQDTTTADTIFRLHKLFIGIFYGATFVGNAALTVLIASKIWRTTKRIRESSVVIETSTYIRTIAALYAIHKCQLS